MKHTLPKAVALLASGVLVSTLAACSGGPGGSSDAITIWYRPGSLPAQGLETVKEKFPDVTIDLVQTPDVDTKIASALRSRSGVPDIAVATLSNLLPAADQLVDVSEYGFDDVADQYLEWKVVAGQGDDGRQIAIPIDIGPVGFFYRADVMEEAGYPSDPAAVGELVADWDSYETLAREFAAKGTYLCDSGHDSIYTPSNGQKGYYYYDDDKQYTPDTAVNEESFLRAASFAADGVCLNVSPYEQDWNAGIAQGDLAGWIGPAYQAGLMYEAAADQSGSWRVTTVPGGASSATGSSLSVFKTSKDPQVATEIAEYLTNPENQSEGYASGGLFPSTPESYESPEMTQPEEYFGGQVVNSVLGPIATEAPVFYSGQSSPVALSIFNEALKAFRQQGGDAQAAYAAAVEQAEAQG